MSPTQHQRIRGYVHRIQVGSDESLLEALKHLRTVGITDINVAWESVSKKWYLDFYWPHENVEWALEALRPHILPPLEAPRV